MTKRKKYNTRRNSSTVLKHFKKNGESSSNTFKDDDFIVNDDSSSNTFEDDIFIDNDNSFNNYEQDILCLELENLPVRLKNVYHGLKKEMDEEKPTLEKILNSNLCKSDKKHCIYIFNRLLTLEPFSVEYLELMRTINLMILNGNKLTTGDMMTLELIEHRILANVNPDENLKNKILSMDADDSIISIVYLQYLELLRLEPGTTTYSSLREEIDWSTKLPHRKTIGTSLFQDHQKINLRNNKNNNVIINQKYSKVLKSLDKELYGMQNIKTKILHILNDRRTSGFAPGRNLALKGPPGVGKTMIGKSLAKILGLPFEKISVGGLEDATVLKGSDKVWNSATPSIILQILARLKYSDVVIMFDEVDKLGLTAKGREVQYALLHISDYAHNDEFKDNYLNKYSHDLSRIWFIYCMNTDETLDSALKDRFDIEEVKDYTKEEKKNIIKDYMLPKACKNVGLNEKNVKFTKSGLEYFIDYTLEREPVGLRYGEKKVKNIVGKINMYLSVCLHDGTTGDLKLSYSLPSTKFPIKLNEKLVKELMSE